MNEKKEIVLSLISHTNIGKTTLARTLLRQEVGTVRDEAHVTDESTSYTMLETATEALILWDTPGFGNVSQLIKRLQAEKGAWGWLMHEVIDRVFNRGLFCSFEAAKHVRHQAEVVLYLVNVQEHPNDAGYISSELKLLDLIGKPVVMILNQVGDQELADAAERKALETLWYEHFSQFKCLKSVMVLDAFTRTWYQELRLIDMLKPLVDESSQSALDRLARAHLEQQSRIFKQCAAYAANLLWEIKSQRIDPDTDKNPKALFEQLVADLQNKLDAYLDLLVEIHGIQAEGRAEFQADLQQVTGLTASKLDEKKSGLLAGALSSASTGLMADMLSGGLTFGGGAILGFLGGFFGGLSYAKMMNLRKRGSMTWRHDTLLELYYLLMVYYLVAIHHGRGRGKLNLDQPLDFIGQIATETWQGNQNKLKKLLDEYAKVDDSDTAAKTFKRQAEKIFSQGIHGVIAKLYPDSSRYWPLLP